MEYWMITVLFDFGEQNYLISHTSGMSREEMSEYVLDSFRNLRSEIININVSNIGQWEVQQLTKLGLPIQAAEDLIPALKKIA